MQCRPIGLAHRPDGQTAGADVAGEVAPVRLFEAAVEIGEALHRGHRHEEVAALAADLALDAALLVGAFLARDAEEGVEAIVGAQGDETLSLGSVSSSQDPGHEGTGVVVSDPGRHPADAGKGGDMTLEERLLTLGAESDVDSDARVREAQLEDRDRGALAGHDHVGETEVDLGFGASQMVSHDRNVAVLEVQLAAALADIPPDGGFAHVGAALVEEALPDPPGRVALLSRCIGIGDEPFTDRRRVGSDSRLNPRLDGLAWWRDRAGEGLADRSPVHPMTARQLADRHPFLPVVSADTLELLHPRQLLPPSLVMASQDQSSLRN